ncbi:MAG: tetratricopeptide repeat protein [Kofleriaceae bacterium]
MFVLPRSAPSAIGRLGRGAGRALMLSVVTLLLCMSASRVLAQAEDDLREGDRYFEEGEWRKAAAAYDRAIRQFPRQVAAEAYAKRATIYIILKDFKGGLAFVDDTAKTVHPNAPEVLEQEALILWELGQKERSVQVAEKVVADKPKAFTNQKLIGEFYSGKNATKTAAAYQAYLSNRPADLEAGDVLPRVRLGFALISKAREALALSDGDKANETYGKAAEQFEIVQAKHSRRPNAEVNAANGLCAAYTGLGRFDQAIAICERITQDPRKIDSNGSVWYNLATSYLAKKQGKKARSAVAEYNRIRKNEARGLMLLGDAFFLDREWQSSLDTYLRAERQLRPSQTHERIQLSIRLGKTYRRLPSPPGGGNANLQLVIEKLAAGAAANPGSVELAVELGGAYIEAGQDANAAALTERMIGSADFAKNPANQRVALLSTSAKALFNQDKLRDSRAQFEAARELAPTDVTIQRALVDTINAQAFAALSRDSKAAQGFLDQALLVDPKSPVTLTNVAVLAMDRGDCDRASGQLEGLRNKSGADSLLVARLLARSYLCANKPNPKKAATVYEEVEAEAKKVAANQLLAEVYVEWGPLLWDTNPSDAVEKLTQAVQLASQQQEILAPAKRNLAVALFRRGWKLMKEGKSGDAASDFERATRESSSLRGTEPAAFDFSLALALLDKGQTGEASKIFKKLASRGNQASYLRAPYAKLGNQFFGAYANYRSGNLSLRQQAASEFSKISSEASGSFAAKVRDLIGSSWELVAYDLWRAGRYSPASKALASAMRYADGDIKRRAAHNRAVLLMSRESPETFEAFAGNPPEAWVNAGIAHDQAGHAREAYEAWLKAKARGVSTRDLQRWIDAKKRIYGF